MSELVAPQRNFVQRHAARRMGAGDCERTPTARPHPEEPRSGVSKDEWHQRGRMVRDGATRLLTMRDKSPQFVGAALSASAGLEPASFLSPDGIGVYGHEKRTQPAALARGINEPG
ncbi:hypothetical protein FFI89_009795 [Bradyrhizobium sp. KBS0727]|nr:hypothetical protein FFI71_009795 [Bradyrhizobium sp. KBS0725]QDW44013.1 hypothetical protein FFI89_009795 [Bradyrhizobium sp. KBS0727]